MARLRTFTSYRNLKRPYTRTSKFKAESYIKMTFQYTLNLLSKADLQIRDNALESARQTSNKLLETYLGLSGFHLKIKVYPHHIMREHALASGAGADRFSSGMAHSFGKPAGVAARIKKGQAIFQVSVDKQNLGVAKQALERASKKLPCACTIQVTERK